jgi:hypothetical protein
MTGPDTPPGSEVPAGFTLPRFRIDRSGDWFDGDGEITHPGIVANLRSNLRRDAEGYFIKTRVRIPVEVEDAPFVVERVEVRGERLAAVLNDGAVSTVDPATVRVTADDVPYCAVKEGAFEARLSRAAAYQLLALVETDPATGAATLRVGSRRYPWRPSARAR